MSTIFQNLTDATAVKHVVRGQFTSATTNNLIVAKDDFLQVFDIVRVQRDSDDVEDAFGSSMNLRMEENDAFMETNMQLIRTHEHTVYTLRLVYQTRVFGTIKDLAVVKPKLGGFTTDLLVLLTNYAKVSILVWDSLTQQLSTVSMHYYESVVPPKPIAEETPAQLIVDPESTCCVLRFYGDMMAIIPFRKPEDLEMEDANAQSEKPVDVQCVYLPSFVLTASQLDYSIARVLDSKFLEGYREATLALLYCPEQTSTVFLPVRKDTVSLAVITLDIEQRASAVITSIHNLPYDIYCILPVPAPLGGSLLLGGNEIIYVDSAGSTVGIAVNPFYRNATNFQLEDRSSFQLELEGTIGVPLSSPRTESVSVLLIHPTGQLFYLDFLMDGKNVKNLDLHPASDELNNALLQSGVTCALPVADHELFLGSQTGDSYLVQWSRRSINNQTQEEGTLTYKDEENDADEEVDELDDIYDTGSKEKAKRNKFVELGPLRLEVHDVLSNVGPIIEFCTGKAGSLAYFPQDNHGPLEVTCVTGTGKSGSLVVFRRSISPVVEGKFNFEGCQSLWTIHVTGRLKNPRSHGSERYLDDEYDTYLVVSKEKESFVFTAGETFDEVEDSDFNTKGSTINVGGLLGGMRIVQICTTSLRVYDPNIHLVQRINLGKKQNVVAASVCDPYVVLVLLGGRILLYSMDAETQRLIKMDLHKQLKNVKAASLYSTNDPVMQELFSELDLGRNNSSPGKSDIQMDGVDTQPDRPSMPAGNQVTETNVSTLDEQSFAAHFVLFVLHDDGRLKVLHLPTYSCVLECDVFDLPTVLYDGLSSERVTEMHESSQELVEVLATDLGDEAKEAHLLIRSRMNEITVYKPFVCSNPVTHKTELRFSKIPQEGMTRESTECSLQDLVAETEQENAPKDASEQKPQKSSSTVDKPRMVALQRIGNHSAVFITGAKPFFLLKTAHSVAKFHPLLSECRILSLASFHTEHAPKGYIFVDENYDINICRFQDDINYDHRWGYKKVNVGRSVHGIAYHPTKMVYAIATSTLTPYEVTDEEGNVVYPLKNEGEYLPRTNSGMLELVSPLTWTVIDRYKFLDYEIPLCVRLVNLEISDVTKLRKPFIAVGTSITKGEDIAVRGSTYLFEIIDVVPQPGHPETRHKLKLVTREEIKGTVAVVSEINGYLLSGQGQKVIVRALEDEDHLVGVAFIDLGSYTVVAKSLRNLLIFGDIRQSISFVGFAEEPYRMTLFAKGQDPLSVSSADFLVQGQSLYFAVADMRGNLRILAYDPENPESHSGERLVTRGDIHVGHIITAIHLVPKMKKDRPGEVDYDEGDEFACITTNSDGSLQALCPISERVYRRLNIIQNYLANRIETVGGLNPRSYRLINTVSSLNNATHRILDGGLIEHFSYMSVAHRQEMAYKCGVPISTIMNDLVELDEALNYM
ncbi:cleavage factor one Cft1 [Schizosaccharomyces japonicus yFS275]|uniref:Cleavage factor one Cft1 n=1 Tax=Schizosaccharomyces japonicus (strain yFS275 / FY16936) TaxID=402676 RepID=B6K3P3_SCHJY|nr:cleavage factor one Cft1 [Schizosaccharomyces japonicus yFS275]EEB08100.1 cleavage factor one Cft1 [Schizosaccharomyces japonicus yFS275]